MLGKLPSRFPTGCKLKVQTEPLSKREAAEVALDSPLPSVFQANWLQYRNTVWKTLEVVQLNACTPALLLLAELDDEASHRLTTIGTCQTMKTHWFHDSRDLEWLKCFDPRFSFCSRNSQDCTEMDPNNVAPEPPNKEVDPPTPLVHSHFRLVHNHPTIQLSRFCVTAWSLISSKSWCTYVYLLSYNKNWQECTFCLWRWCLHCCWTQLKPFNMLTHRNLQASILPSITGILKIFIETSCLLAVLQLACCTSWHAGKITVTLSNRMQT